MAICSISNEERDSLYQMVYNNFYKASLENKAVDVESYMKELIDLISKKYLIISKLKLIIFFVYFL